jgi:Polyketide cyclase / dehydrase and lipid transport
VLEIDRTVSAQVKAPPDRCLALLRDVAGYPRWARLVGEVEVLDDDRVRLRADVLGLPVVMTCRLEAAEGSATLRRLPNDPDDDEAFVAAWTVREAPGGVDVELRVRAAMNAPGPARLLRGRVERKLADELLADFAAAV